MDVQQMIRQQLVAIGTMALLAVALPAGQSHAATVTASGTAVTNTTKTTTSSTVTIKRLTSINAHPYALRAGATLYKTATLKSGKVAGSKFARTTWYRNEVATLSVKGKTRTAYRVTSANRQSTYWVLATQLKSVLSASFNLKLAGAGSTFTTTKIGVLGDSIPDGWDGSHFYHVSYPRWTAKYLGSAYTVTDDAFPDATIVGQRWKTWHGLSRPQDLGPVINANKKALAKMDMILINIGTNDYANGSGSGSLSNVIAHLKLRLKTVQKINPTATIYGILPLTRYGYDGINKAHVRNDQGYTLNQLRVAEQKLYRQMGIKVVNFNAIAPNVITDANHRYTLQDQILHPSAQTAQKLGYALAKKILADETTY
jgi:hypothetical protein